MIRKRATWMAMMGLHESSLMIDPANAFALFPKNNRKGRIKSYLLDRRISKFADSHPLYMKLLNIC